MDKGNTAAACARRLPPALILHDIVILTGVLETRLRDVLPETPQILAPLGDRSFLHHLLHWLIRQGPRRVGLSLRCRPSDVPTYIETRSFAPLEIHSIVEPEALAP